MSNSIGQYIKKWFRFKNISNAKGGEFIGLSESAFEKILTKDDILIGRLLLLSAGSETDLFEFYYDQEPLKSFRQKEIDEWNSKIVSGERDLNNAQKLIEAKDELLETQRKLIMQLEEKVKLLSGKTH